MNTAPYVWAIVLGLSAMVLLLSVPGLMTADLSSVATAIIGAVSMLASIYQLWNSK